MLDRRRTEVRTDSATLGAMLVVMGWFASPWNPTDTLFTRILSDGGLETTWGMVMMLAGLAKMASALVINPPLWAEPYWPRFKTCANLLLVFVSWWTFLHFAEVNLYTPTVLALGVIGAGALATLVRDANNKKALRCRYGGLTHNG